MSLKSRSETQRTGAPSGTGWPTGTTALVADTPNARVAVYSLAVSTQGVGTIALVDTAAAAVSGVYSLAAGSPLALDQNNNGDPRWITVTGKGLSIVVTGGPAFGDIWWKFVEPGS